MLNIIVVYPIKKQLFRKLSSMSAMINFMLMWTSRSFSLAIFAHPLEKVKLAKKPLVLNGFRERYKA